MPHENFSVLVWEEIELKSYRSEHNTDYATSYHYEIERAKVFGGWLVRASNFNSSKLYKPTGTVSPISGPNMKLQSEAKGIGVGITFIPDPNYEWKLEKPGDD